MENLGGSAFRLLIETQPLLFQHNLCTDVGPFLGTGLAQYNAMGWILQDLV